MFPAEEVDSQGEQKSLREVILYDESDHLAITIRGNLLEEISEETIYLFQNIFLKDFYGLKLTTRATIVSCEGPVSFPLPQDAVTTYMELKKQLKNHGHPKKICGFSSPGCFSRLQKHHVWKASCCYFRSAIHFMPAMQYGDESE